MMIQKEIKTRNAPNLLTVYFVFCGVAMNYANDEYSIKTIDNPDPAGTGSSNNRKLELMNDVNDQFAMAHYSVFSARRPAAK